MSPINTFGILAFASAALAVPFGHENHRHFHKAHEARAPAPQGTYGESSAPSYGQSSSASAPPYPLPSSSGASGYAYPSGGSWGATGYGTGYLRPTGYAWSHSAAASSAAAWTATEEATTTSTVTIRVSPSPAPAGWQSSAAPIENEACTPDTTVTTKVTLTTTVTAHGGPPASSPVAPASESAAPYSAAPSSPASAPAYSAPASAPAPPPAYSAPAESSGAPAPASYAPAAASGAVSANTQSKNSQSVGGGVSGIVSSATGGLAGGKRGLGYNDASLANLFLESPSVGWAYNWVSGSAGLSSGSMYIPELHDMSETFTSVWQSEAQAAIDAGAQWIFGFNEPDIPSQANLSPEDAAAGWMKYIQPFAQQGVKLVAPAVSNSGESGQGLEWLSAFMAACQGCTFDAVNQHWYDYTSNDISSLQNQINAAASQTNLPVFVGEFGFIGSDSDISSALEQAMGWMDSQDNVLGYAYYYLSDGLLLDGSSPSAYGLTFLG